MNTSNKHAPQYLHLYYHYNEFTSTSHVKNLRLITRRHQTITREKIKHLKSGFVGSFANNVFANAPPSIKATGVKFILSVTSPTAQIDGTDVREYSST